MFMNLHAEPSRACSIFLHCSPNEGLELENLPDVINDLDFDIADNPAASAAYLNDQRNIRKVKEATSALQLNVIHPLREGKKLLVLDIDYSKFSYTAGVSWVKAGAAILDTKPLTSGSLPPAECARPHLHEFLEAVYPYYDSEPLSVCKCSILTRILVCIWCLFI